MKLKTLLVLLLITSCSTTNNSSIISNSNINSSANSTNFISTPNNLDDEQTIKLEIDQLFSKTLKEERAKNGNLNMYSFIENLYPYSLSNTRRKALYYMILNPKLEEYILNPYIKDMFDKIIFDQNKIFIPEDEQSGFLIPYLITLPEEKYKQENLGFKQYMFFEASNHIDINTPWGNFNQMLPTRSFNNGYAMDMVPNQLYWPKVLSIMPQPSIRDTTVDEFNMARLLNRISVLATIDDYQKYIVYPNDGFGNKEVKDYGIVWNVYIFRQHLDVEKQSRNIILHSQKIIRDLGYPVEDKIFMGGYSGSGAFTNRFATIYPEMLKATFQGGNLYPILPGSNYKGNELIFPLGVSDNESIFGKKFNLEAYNKIAKLEIIGGKEVWTHYPHDYLENIEKKLGNLFGKASYARLLNNHKAYFELGGEKVTLINKNMGHAMDRDDATYIKEFFKLNRDSDTPVYPTSSTFSQHIYFSHFDQSLLDQEISNNPATFLPYYEGNLLVFTSLVGQGTGGPHEDAAFRRFEDRIWLANSLYDQNLLIENNVFLVVYDTTMRQRLNLRDLKVNITINPGEVVSTVNSDNKRVIVLYPRVDTDGVKMIETLPTDITTKDQRYQFNN